MSIKVHRLVPVIAKTLAILALQAGAADLYVAPDGSDTQPGTAQKPFASIIKARDVARAAGGNNRILLAPGNYFNETTITFDDRDSGLTLKGAKPGALATVYGGMPITGWERWKENIWRAKVPQGKRFFNLIVDGAPATMAQTPNAGSGFGGGATPRGNGAVHVPDEWRNYDFSDAQVFAWIGGDWFSEMREVLDAKPDADGLLKVDGGSQQFGGMNNRIFLRGVLEFLDEPGEWCLKHKEGYLYYWPKSASPENHLCVRPTSQRLIEVHGRTPQTPAKAIALENLSLVGSDFTSRWYLFGPNEDGSTPSPLQQGLIFGENVEAMRITSCKLLAAGHSGVWFNKYAQQCIVENSLISGAGFTGVYANGFMPGEGPFQSGLESYVNKGHRIENNFIYDCGKFVGGGCGVQFYQAGDSLITRNEIGQMPRYGISYKGLRWGCLPKSLYGNKVTFASHYDYLHTRNLKITGNEIYSVCRNSFDFGGIESWSPGRDNEWSYNDLHDIDQTLQWDGWAHVLFPDDASHFLTIRGNILHHCHGGSATGGFMMKSIGQTIENNIVADSTLGRIVSLDAYIEPGGNYTIRRNVFANDGKSSRYEGSPEVYKGFPGTAGSEFPSDVGGIKELDFNIIMPRDPQNPNPLASRGVDLNSFFGDPKLERAKPDWDMTARDYSLAADSPAFSLGFKAIDASQMGLKDDFPFDTMAFTKRKAMGTIQAEDYQRMHELRTNAGVGIYHVVPGSWAKYSNIDFSSGARKAVFQLEEAPAVTQYMRQYGDVKVEALPFKGDQSVETITQWEVSKPYTKTGKNGNELFDEVFPPETDPQAGDWKPLLGPTQSRAGVRTEPGVVNLDVANGEGLENSCAYARCAIYAPVGRTNATMTVSCASGIKVWLNGEQIIAENRPGTFSETIRGVIKQGWNTILIKVNQDDSKWVAQTAGDGNFWFKFGTVASSCGDIVYLPGLPTEERAASSKSATNVELRLDSPHGKLIAKLPPGETECAVEDVSGIHNLYLVFPGANVRTMDWFRFQP
jgi:hypothetical protein